VIHRHLDYPQDTPVERLGPAAIDDILDRGDLDDWAPLVRAVKRDPFGPVAETILRICEAHDMYGTSVLWPALVAHRRAIASGGGHAAWPAARTPVTLADVRRLSGDIRLSTLRRYVEAAGARLRLVVAWPGRAEHFELRAGNAEEDRASVPCPRRGDQPEGRNPRLPRSY